MFTESAELYDLIYHTFKDYAAEATQVAQLLRRFHSSCCTVLDVACGTGEHAFRLAMDHGFVVDGLDLDPELLNVARKKHPAGRFFEADMSSFELPHRYDAITCLFSSIGYLRTLDRVEQALRCFRAHLTLRGIIVVEPWFAPHALRVGDGTPHTGKTAGVTVERTSHTEIDGRLSRLRFDYRVTSSEGVRQMTETHELGLFTPDELLATFERSGLAARYDPQGLTGRGLYVATIAA